jgi:hypothetical protein
MTRHCLAAFAVCLAPVVAVDGQEKPKETYATLLERVKKADPKADFLKLRMAFTETDQYNPYGQRDKNADGMMKALDDEDYTKALELADGILKKKYVDMNSQFVAYRACTALKKEEQAKHHKFVMDGLLRSILDSGDGLSPAKAFVVISTEEEYFVLGAFGIRKTKQALLSEKGQKIDRIDGVQLKAKTEVSMYFNVSRQFTWLERQFKKDE